MREFKVGDKVRLNPSKVTQRDLDDLESSGKFDTTYIIHHVGSINISLKGSNWHEPEWLMHVVSKNVLGGKML